MNCAKLGFYSALITALCTLPVASSQKPDQGVTIHGTVKDLRRRPVEAAALRFSQDQVSVSAHTDSAGSYSVLLPVRAFSVLVEASGFCSHTKTVSVPAEVESFSLDFSLIDCSDCDLRNIDLNDSETDLRDPAKQPVPIDVSKFKYRMELLGGGQPTPAMPAIYYGTKHTEGGRVVYGWLSCPGWPQQKPAILSYRQYVLKALTITYSNEDRSILAEHDVVLFNYPDTKRFSFVKVMVVDGELRILNSK
jgi:hypothetical protein